MKDYLDRTLDFLELIGLPWVVSDEVIHGFLPRIEIRRGVLHLSPKCPISNLLHEAGHLACVPAQFRALISGDVDASLAPVLSAYLDADPDNSLSRALIQCSDPEATAWAWAAGLAVGLPEGMIIKNSEYQQAGRDVRQGLKMNCWPGINGLAHAGMCVKRDYPRMRRWVQPALGGDAVVGQTSFAGGASLSRDRMALLLAARWRR